MSGKGEKRSYFVYKKKSTEVFKKETNTIP